MKKVLSFWPLLAVLLFFGCTPEEVEPETRAQSYGTYSYVAQIYWQNNGGLVDLGSDGRVTGTMKIEANSTETDAINFMENGNLSFRGTKIKASASGFAFDVPSQSFDGLTIRGYAGWTLAGGDYHGIYTNSTKRLECYMQFSSNGENYVIKFTMNRI